MKLGKNSKKDYILKQIIQINDWLIILLSFSLAISNFAFIDPLTRSVLSLTSIIALPYFAGILLLWFCRKDPPEVSASSLWIFFLVRWIVGTVFITTVILVLQLFRLRIIISAFPLLLLLLPIWYVALRIKKMGIFRGLISVVKNTVSLTETIITQRWPIFLMAIVMFAFGLVRLHIPFGTVGTTWDIPLAVNQPVLRMLEDGYFDLNLRWVEVILMSPSVVLSKSSPLEVAWSAPLILGAIFIAGLYLFAIELFGSTSIAAVAALSGIFVNVGHHVLFAQALDSFRSNTICFAVFPSLLLFTFMKITRGRYSISEWKRTILLPAIPSVVLFIVKNSNYLSEASLGLGWGLRTYYVMPILVILLGASIIVLTLMSHDLSDTILFLLIFLFLAVTAPQEGVIFVFFIVLFSLVIIGTQKLQNYKIFFRILGFGLFLLIIVSSSGIFTSVTSDIVLSVLGVWPRYGLTFQEKISIFYEANGLTALLLIFTGIGVAFSSGKRNHLLVFLFFSSALFLYSSSILPQSYRLHKVLTPFTALLIGLAAERISDSAELRGKYLRKTLILIVILIILTSSLSMRMENRFSKFPNYQQSHSIWSPAEYETASWFFTSTGPNVRIISDYNTMVAMNSLANKVWLIGNDFRSDGLSNEDAEILAGIKEQVFLSLNASRAYEYIISLNPTQSRYDYMYLSQTHEKVARNMLEFYIVLSYRTVNWIEQDDLRDVTWQAYPYDPNYPYKGSVNSIYVEPFLHSEHFFLVHNRGQEVYVFKINNSTT